MRPALPFRRRFSSASQRTTILTALMSSSRWNALAIVAAFAPSPSTRKTSTQVPLPALLWMWVLTTSSKRCLILVTGSSRSSLCVTTMTASTGPFVDSFSRASATKRRSAARTSSDVPVTRDVHAFDPTPSSVQAVATASVLIYNGAGLEPWIPSIVAAADNPRLVLVDSSANVSLLLVPSTFQKENRTIDPHVWLNPVLAKVQVANILKGLIQVDPADAAYFTANAHAYRAKLDVLDSEFVNLTANPATRFFVTFHEAFAYFAKQYNLTQIPIAGPFEEDPTPSEIQNVIDAVHANHLCYVGYESLTNPAIAESIASQTNATLVRLDPIEGLSVTDQALGMTYLLKMQDGFTKFALALNHVGCS